MDGVIDCKLKMRLFRLLVKNMKNINDSVIEVFRCEIIRGSTIATSNRRSRLEKSLNAEAIDIFKPLTFKVPIKNSGKKTLQVESNNEYDSTGALGNARQEECAAPGKS